MDKEDLNKIIAAIKDNSLSVSGWIIEHDLSDEDTDIENVLNTLVEEIERLRGERL